MQSIPELGDSLDQINDEATYDLISRIFLQSDSNFNQYSHMELFAASIVSVKLAIKQYMKTGCLPLPNMVHINGLNDINTSDPFYLLDNPGSTVQKVRETINFSHEEIRALKEMIYEVVKNRMALMRKDLPNYEG